MYESFYGLNERPFDLTPDPRFLFLTARHREALSNLEYGIVGRKGITLLIGEAGTGKTTLIRAALDAVRQPQSLIVYLNNPTLTRQEFYELLVAGFGLSEAAASSKAHFLLELDGAVLARHRAGGYSALIIDEAQSLPHELMEEVRLLSNLETATEKLLPVVVAGQPELAERLNDPSLRQLKQRVALRCELGPLGIQETASYIAGRIRIAGGNIAEIFTRDAVAAIHERSRGIPRTISVLCDNALVSGFAADIKPVGRAVVLEVCRDFHLEPARLAGNPAPQPLQPFVVAAGQPTRSNGPRRRAAGEQQRVVAPGPGPVVPGRESDRPDLPPAQAGQPARAVTETPAGRTTASPLFAHFTRRRRFSFF